MASIDLSRHATNFAKHYDGSRLAQGQVLSDDDFNDAARMSQEDMRRSRVDIIGPAGSPDAGFQITSPVVVGGRCSFTLKAGTFYLGGLRLTLEADELFHLQRDWLQQADADRPAPPTAGQTRYDAVYLETFQVPVSGVEDGELMEPAFGGAPPALRVRTVRRVRVETNVNTDDCLAAWTTAKTRWAGLGSLGPDAELKPDATLQVVYGGGGAPQDLCAPGVVTGFLGAENQAIRVQTVAGNRLVWGYDNASRIYRVEVQTVGAARRKLHFLTHPKDAQSRPLAGQIVEILPWSAALANRLRPDGTLDRCEKTAEVSGHLARVESSYNPSDQTLTLIPAEAVPANFGTEWKSRSDNAQVLTGGGEYYFVRVWDQGLDGAAGGTSTPFVAGVPTPLGTTGLSVTLRGTQFPADLYWIVGARPETADQVIPWQFDTDAGRTPQGLRRFRTPLGIVRWTNAGGTVAGTVVDDCRPPFLPLTRIGSCCKITVGDGSTSYGHFNSIGAAVAALPPAGGEICVLAGHYVENVDLSGRENVSIHGCGTRTVVEAPVDGNGDAFGPVFDVTDARNIRITEMSITAHGAEAGIASTKVGVGYPRHLHLADLAIVTGARCAIELLGGEQITILRCNIAQINDSGPWPAVYVAADHVQIEHNHIIAAPKFLGLEAKEVRTRGGLQIGGGSSHVRIIDNQIEGGIGNGITLGSIIQIDEKGQEGIIFWWVSPYNVCDPCKPGDIVVIFPEEEEGKTSYRNAGDLYDILIERNRIVEMGLNGIGPVGFFDLIRTRVLITINDLRIIGNVIHRCLQREILQTTVLMQFLAGYGAISLPACHRLLIEDNDLVENGLSHLDPVCGVFVLFGSSIDISNNRIEENGPRSDESTEGVRRGYRSGIHVGLAIPRMLKIKALEDLKGHKTMFGGGKTGTPPPPAAAPAAPAAAAPDGRTPGGPPPPEGATTPQSEYIGVKGGMQSTVGGKYPFAFEKFRRMQGVDALRVHDNVVTQPVGRSLTAAALGHISIADNAFTSRGMPGRDLLHMLASNVAVVGLGLSSEMGLLPLIKMIRTIYQDMDGDKSFDDDKWKEQACDYFNGELALEATAGFVIPSSKVKFVNNRCAQDLMGDPPGLVMSSVLVVGTDDVAFGGNQVEFDLPFQYGVSNSMVGGMSVRAYDNRWAETRRRVIKSAYVGGLLNATTNNQSTHCLQVFGPSQFTIVDEGNKALIEAFCGGICK